MSDLKVLCDNIINNPEASLIEYNISEKYVRDLTPVFGIKEFIANFYDMNGKDFDMTYKNQVLILEDLNQGIDLRFMIIGNSGSRDDKNRIGEHGEGFKIGALTIIRDNNSRVLIETVSYSIVFYMEYSETMKTNIMCAKYVLNERKKGTKMYIECSVSNLNKAKGMFLFLNNYEIINNNIIDTPNGIKHIYLNGLSHVTKKALFSYNIFEKNQISNRDRNFIKDEILDSHLINIYNNLFDSEEIVKIMDRIMDNPQKFDNYLESRIINQLSLSSEQKEMFKNSLNQNLYYTVNLKLNKSKNNNDFTIIEVSNSLFYFLQSLGANVLIDSLNEDDLSKQENIISFFKIPFSQVKNMDAIEMSTATLLSDGIVSSVEEDVGYYNIGINYTNAKELMKNFSLSNRFYKTSNEEQVKRIVNNLIYLTCNSKIKIEWTFENATFNFECMEIEKYYYVLIKEQLSNNEKQCLRIIKEKPFEKSVEILKDNFIYLNNLKFLKPNSIYSYNISNHKGKNLTNNSDLKNVLNTPYFENYISSTNEIKFIEMMFDNLLDNKIEFTFEWNVSVKNVEKVFKSKFPKGCLKHHNEQHNDIVSNVYGYTVLSPSTELNYKLYMHYNIPTASSIFRDKQKENIDTIDLTPNVIEGIEIFKNLYHVDEIMVKLALYLDNHKKSLNKNGIIYIANDAVSIPEYVAGLIAYEYYQIEYECETPSHELQSLLTHGLFDRIKLPN